MPALTLYPDNSVVGGYFDPEFEEATKRLWTLAESGQCRFVASVVTQQEASLAPSEVVRLFDRTFPDNSCLLPLTDRAEELAQAYVQAQVLTAKYVDDAVMSPLPLRMGSASLSVGTSSIWPTTSENRVLTASIWYKVIPACGSLVRRSLFMETTTKTFDAVAESRKWKEAVACETEGMSRDEVVAYFDREAVQRRFQSALERSRVQETGPTSKA